MHSLRSLPSREAGFIEPMECLAVSKRTDRIGSTRSYVVHHIRSLLWRSALCGAGDAVLDREAHERSPNAT
jgi:hypothetical protein